MASSFRSAARTCCCRVLTAFLDGSAKGSPSVVKKRRDGHRGVEVVVHRGRKATDRLRHTRRAGQRCAQRLHTNWPRTVGRRRLHSRRRERRVEPGQALPGIVEVRIGVIEGAAGVVAKDEKAHESTSRMVKKLPSDFDIFSSSTRTKPLCIQ